MMIRDLCIVYTGNKHNQVMIFKNCNDADQFLKDSTKLGQNERKRRIRKPSVIGNMGFVFEPADI